MTEEQRWMRGGWAVLAVIAAVEIWYNGQIPLSGDEAYYWVWSLNLQAGYYDHPPAIAALIRAMTALFGDGLSAVRMAAVVCLTGACVYVQIMTNRVFGPRAAALALALAVLVPVSQMGFSLATPDAPLTLFWSAAACHGLEAATGRGRWRDFLLTGLFAGLALQSKYTAVLLPAALILFVVMRRRDLLASGKLWAAAALAAAVFAPVILWNATHGFESFSFQYNHGSAKGGGIEWHGFVEFLAGQAVVLSPLVLVVLILALAGRRWWWQDDRRLYLALCFLAPMALFVEKALWVKVQLNWAAPAYATAMVLVAGWWEPRLAASHTWRRSALAGTALAMLMTLALKWPMALGLGGPLNIHNRIFGNVEAAAEMQTFRQDGDTIFADDLIRAALLQYLLPGHPRVYIPTDTRISEYSRWDRDTDWRSLHGLYIAKDDRTAELRTVFGKAEVLKDFIVSAKGFRDQRFVIWRVG